MSLLDYLSDEMLMSKADIVNYSITSPHRYKIYEIPKRRSNGKRVIAHPASELKLIQRLIIKYLAPKLQLHASAFAYRKGLSVKHNAMIHLNTRYLLKMDFYNFFPSITPKLFFSSLESSDLHFDAIDKKIMSGLIFCKYQRSSPLVLSIGAPSSPLISNFIMYSFDEFIHTKCTALNVKYSRYADDITFSSNEKNVLFKIPEIVRTALETYTYNQIRINSDKTIFSSKGHNRHITGVTLTNDNNLSVGRERKRLISSMIHWFVNGKLTDESIQILQGHFAYAIYIEPDLLNRMILKYGANNIVNLTTYQVEKS